MRSRPTACSEASPNSWSLRSRHFPPRPRSERRNADSAGPAVAPATTITKSDFASAARRGTSSFYWPEVGGATEPATVRQILEYVRERTTAPVIAPMVIPPTTRRPVPSRSAMAATSSVNVEINKSKRRPAATISVVREGLQPGDHELTPE